MLNICDSDSDQYVGDAPMGLNILPLFNLVDATRLARIIYVLSR